jgi:hypothetical protein
MRGINKTSENNLTHKQGGHLMETTIRRASIADKDDIWSFIKVAYGDFSKHILPRRWTWQYLENPSTVKENSQLPIILAIKGDQIVGQACVTGVKLKLGNEIHLATWGTDYIVLPVCRGEGVGKKLMQVEAEHFPFMIGLWMPFVTRKIAAQLGYKTLDPVYVYWRPGRLHRFFVNHYLMLKTKGKPASHRLVKVACRFFFIDRLIPATMNLFLSMRGLMERWTKEKNHCDIQEIDYFDERIDDFWNSTQDQYEIIVQRNKEFLNWRYSPNHPLRYRKFIATKDGQVRGYIILRRAQPEELNVGKIVDLYARRDDQQTIEGLIRHAINIFGNDVEVIECAAAPKEYQETLAKHGFFKVETAVPMYRCEDASLANEMEARKSNCFFTKGDHDWDQFTPVQQI